MSDSNQTTVIGSDTTIKGDIKVNKTALKNAISEHASKLMVVSEPFSVAYGLGALDNTMILDIGAGTVDFCIMHGTVPMEEDQRSLLMAGDYVDEQLLKLLNEKHPVLHWRELEQELALVGFVDRVRGDDKAWLVKH